MDLHRRLLIRLQGGTMNLRHAAISGGTGLVGQSLCQQIQENPSWSNIMALTRRSLGPGLPRIQPIECDYDHLEAALQQLGHPDTAFCCLGTTIKKAGSQEAFKKIDLDYVLAFAQGVFNLGTRHFIYVSAVGANPRSLFFYSRIKGQVEASLATIGFQCLTIIRPSLLLGDRPEKRLGEDFIKILNPLLKGPFKGYRGIPASTVARAMLYAANHPQAGVTTYESHELFELGDDRQSPS